MTYSYWDRPPQKAWKASAAFACKKIRKLYPLHLVMLFAGAIYLLLCHTGISVILKRLLLTIPLVQTWIPKEYQAINTVAWYLSVSLFLYFMFPHLLSWIKSGKTGMAVVKMIAIYLAQIIIGYCVFRFTEIDIKWVTYCHPIYRLGDFAIGGFLAAIYRNSFQKRAPVSKVMCSILELAAILVNLFTCVYFAYAPEHTTWATFTVLFIPSSILLIYAFSFDNGMISRLLKNRIVYWLADISPYAFLIHRLVISYYHLFVVKTLHREHFNFAFVIMIPFVVTVAFVYTYRFFEKKVLRRAKSK